MQQASGVAVTKFIGPHIRSDLLRAVETIREPHLGEAVWADRWPAAFKLIKRTLRSQHVSTQALGIFGKSMQSDDKFSLRSRTLTGFLGAIAFFGGVVHAYLPPDKFSVERDGHWKVVKATFESTDTTILSAVLAIGGLVLVLYAINGYKLIRFAAGGFSAEAEHAKDRAQNFYKAGAEMEESKQVATAREAPQPTEPAVGTVKQNGEELAVYELKDVPLSVISDAITAWPNEDGAPRSIADFEFATRKKGKGNHPWTIKFQGKPAITVSYGGQGKAGATVGPGIQ